MPKKLFKSLSLDPPLVERGKTGVVTLVGAGPGDPDLITVAGLRALRKAEIVFYDALVDKELLKTCSAKCQKVCVGKRAGRHSYTQTQINTKLLDSSKQYQRIVRLKGGDPFLFGRGCEEVEYLNQHGVQTCVIPGVTSALAVPAAAGIPVTDRRVTSDLAIITGTETSIRSRLNYRAYAQIGTLVFLMGYKNLSMLSKKLIQAGKAKTTPVAVISQGTLPEQQVVVGDLASISAKVATAQLKAPVVIVVGKVIKLARHT